MKKQFIKIADIVLIAVILCLGLLWITIKNTNEPCEAIIYIDGQVFKHINLQEVKEDETITVNNVNIFVLKTGAIGISSSTCPDKVCVNSKAVSKPGSTIACVPNKVVITVKATENNFDGVTG